MVKSYNIISIPNLKRLALYFLVFKQKLIQNIPIVRIKEFADLTGISETQIKEDFTLLDCFSKTKNKGTNVFNTKEIIKEMEKFFYSGKKRNVLVVGTNATIFGLLSTTNLTQNGINLVGIVDIDKEYIGETLLNHEIMDLRKVKELNKNKDIDVVILAVGERHAELSYQLCVKNGIKAFWNFTNVLLSEIDDVLVWNQFILNDFMLFNVFLDRRDGVGLAANHPELDKIPLKSFQMGFKLLQSYKAESMLKKERENLRKKIFGDEE